MTGDDLSTISKGTGKDGAPIVQFGLNPAGASRLYQLTVRNEPTENVYRTWRSFSTAACCRRTTQRCHQRSRFDRRKLFERRSRLLDQYSKVGILPAALGKNQSVKKSSERYSEQTRLTRASEPRQFFGHHLDIRRHLLSLRIDCLHRSIAQLGDGLREHDFDPAADYPSWPSRFGAHRGYVGDANVLVYERILEKWLDALPGEWRFETDSTTP